jgi:hypothetical protein
MNRLMLAGGLCSLVASLGLLTVGNRSPKPVQAAAVAQKAPLVRCKGWTVKGKRCRRQGRFVSGFCHDHTPLPDASQLPQRSK